MSVARAAHRAPTSTATPRSRRAFATSDRRVATTTTVVPRAAREHHRFDDDDGKAVSKIDECVARVAAIALSACVTCVSPVGALIDAPSASAALSNPNTRLPRNAAAALRRAVPAVNEETRAMQIKLEDAAYLLRIPQRKPWSTMSKDVEESRVILSEKRGDVFGPVRAEDRADAEDAYGTVSDALERLSVAASTQDFDTFDVQVARALDALSRLQIAQAPGLPFQIPAKYADLPKLVGRAAVEIQVRNRDGTNFGLLNGEKLETATLEITVDGYNAPITAGNFIDNVRRGVYRGAPMRRSETAILGGSTDPSKPSIPLEIKSSDSFDPLYRAPLDVQNGEAIPSIPLSINGSVAMARSGDGQSDKDQFFVYLFDKRSAGLGGLSFEEGEFSVFGYVTKGEEYLGSIGTNAEIVDARVLFGADKLLNAGEVPVPVDTDFPQAESNAE
jgi:cyclophilin family peptidyl-prolyl cis-trans isomerase